MLTDDVKKEWEYNTNLINEFRSFDKFVFTLPVWNLSIPNTFKLYIDHLV